MLSNIKSEFVLITPELARGMLIDNEGNRRKRDTWINYLAYCIRNGEWKPTHQGIAFSKNGKILDGQHRLHAIIKADTPVLMMVSRGFDEDTFTVIDNGMRRTDEDRTKKSIKLVSCAKFFNELMNGEGIRFNGDKVTRYSPKQLQNYFNVIEEIHEDLDNFCPTSAVFFSSAIVRAAAISNILLGEDRDYVFTLYRNLVLSTTEELPNIGHYINRQVTVKRIGSHGGRDVRIENFLKMFYVFKKRNKDSSSISSRRTVNERVLEIRKQLKPFFVSSNITE